MSNGWKDNSIRIELVRSWREEEIVELYRAAGWWKEEMDPTRINDLIRGSFLFAVAIDISTGRAVGMGRVISDGIADGYIQDLVVQSDRRSWGVGRMIVARLLEECKKRKITWIGLIAKPGKEDFYRSLGFAPMSGHVPMLFAEEGSGC
ncbi:MAG: Acetyltransferase (GNAT) family protein [Methanosaeta sp. PtaU1.Bin112]|nr:MAG: Acetyltransferase (GNAT) family protein [Methanosaeta sp. PtaU1.Bin112]